MIWRKWSLAALPLLVIYTHPISTTNGFLRFTFYDITLGFLVVAVAYTRRKRHLNARARHWAFVAVAYWIVVAIILAKEPNLLAAAPSIGGVILGAAALFVVIEHPTRFQAKRLMDMWLIALAVTAVVAAGQIAGPGRGIGFFRFPNELGTYGLVSVGLIVMAHYLRLTARPLLLGGLGASAIVLLASGGRSALVSAAVLLALYGGLYIFTSSHNFARSVMVVAPIIIATVILTTTASFNVNQTIAGSAGVSSQRIVEAWEQRDIGSFFVENWQQGWTLFTASPGFGWPISEALVDSSILGGNYTVHNTPLSLLVNYGVIGLLLLSTPFVLLYRNRLLPPMGIGLVLLGGLVAHMLYHDVTESRTVWLALAIVVRAFLERTREREALLITVEEEAPEPASSEVGRRPSAYRRPRF